MLGFMTARRAAGEGYTHHGRMFGIPIWLDAQDSTTARIVAKWAPLDLLLVLLAWLFSLLPIPGSGFPVWVGPEIEATGKVPPKPFPDRPPNRGTDGSEG